MSLSLLEIQQATKGRWLVGGPPGLVRGLSTDSRRVKKGELFIAFKGDFFDGHHFIKQAFEKGASGALISQHCPVSVASLKKWAAQKGRFLMVVPDSLKAYGDLAAYYRRQLQIPIIAITGSNGKTSTKEMVDCVLRQQYRTTKTYGNLNNFIGLPQSVFEIKPRHEIAILEMGMNVPGEIKRLAHIANPTVGIITNIGRAHLQGMKSVRAIAKAKAELLRALSKKAVAILNRDDAQYSYLKSQSKGRVFTVGLKKSASWKASHVDVLYSNDGLPVGMKFRVLLDGKEQSFEIPAVGTPFVANALVAIALGRIFQVPLPKIKRGLKSFKSVSGRMQHLKVGGLHFYNDTYNANPDSMLASLQTMLTLKKLARKKFRLIVVLGDMGELGTFEKKGHSLVGEAVAKAPVDVLVSVGQRARHIATRAKACGSRACDSRVCGMETQKVFHCDTKQEAAVILLKILRPGDLVLIKGSRFMKMEELLSILIKNRKQKRR